MNGISGLLYLMRKSLHDSLSFAASGLSMRTGSKLSVSNHSHGYAFSPENFARHTCTTPAIRNLMKNPG